MRFVGFFGNFFGIYGIFWDLWIFLGIYSKSERDLFE